MVPVQREVLKITMNTLASFFCLNARPESVVLLVPIRFYTGPELPQTDVLLAPVYICSNLYVSQDSIPPPPCYTPLIVLVR